MNQTTDGNVFSEINDTLCIIFKKHLLFCSYGIHQNKKGNLTDESIKERSFFLF